MHRKWLIVGCLAFGTFCLSDLFFWIQQGAAQAWYVLENVPLRYYGGPEG